MTDYLASTDDKWGAVNFTMGLTGKTGGRTVPPPGTAALSFSVGAIEPYLLGGVDYAFVDGGSSPVGTSDHDVVRDDRTAMTGDYWFETVHLIPRDGLDYGNIITTQDQRFELFSAFRSDNVTLTNVVINATPGMELPDMPVTPYVMGPMSSILDPTSTNLNPLAQICRALSQGLPSFDTTVDFQIAAGVGTIYLGVQGNRIALLTADFDGPLTETLGFKTNVLEHKDGSEQRISVRKNPRQSFAGKLYLVDVQRQIVQALLFGWQGMNVVVPAWSEQMTVSAAVTGGTTDTISVESTDYLDLRIGGLAAIIKDDTTYDVLTVQSLTSTSVTFEQTIANSYSINDTVVPARLCVIDGPVQGRRHPVNLELMRAKFLVIENDVGAPTADVSAFSAYDGKVLLDDFNFINGGQVAEVYEHKTNKTDSVSGIVTQSTSWEQNKRSHVKGFVVKSSQDLWNVRRLLYALRGRQVAFYVPTFIEDMTVTQNLASGTDTIDISYMGYSRFVQDRAPKSIFKITFTDATSLVREVQSSAVLSGTEERLDLDTTWPANRTVSEIQRVQFYELVRGDVDDVKIEHGTTTGKAKIFYPVKVVFD